MFVLLSCSTSDDAFTFYSDYLTEEVVEGFDDSRRGRQVIYTVKNAVDLVLLAKEEIVIVT
jgi:hypothetical protein